MQRPLRVRRLAVFAGLAVVAFTFTVRHVPMPLAMAATVQLAVVVFGLLTAFELAR